MKYRIKIYYQTGDSFSTRDEESCLDGDWGNIDIIKENIKRIKEHNDWFRYEHNYYPWLEKVEKPIWLNSLYDFSINLKLDNGVEYNQSTFWCGYFEHLYGAEAIMIKEENGLEFRY
jgi:hypothetical protein